MNNVLKQLFCKHHNEVIGKCFEEYDSGFNYVIKIFHDSRCIKCKKESLRHIQTIRTHRYQEHEKIIDTLKQEGYMYKPTYKINKKLFKLQLKKG